MITKTGALSLAYAAGATPQDIVDETARQKRQVGTVPFRNMIKALNMMTAFNTRDDWTRLAAALIARSVKS